MKTIDDIQQEINNWVQVGLNIIRLSNNSDLLYVENRLIEKAIPIELLRKVMEKIKQTND